MNIVRCIIHYANFNSKVAQSMLVYVLFWYLIHVYSGVCKSLNRTVLVVYM